MSFPRSVLKGPPIWLAEEADLRGFKYMARCYRDRRDFARRRQPDYCHRKSKGGSGSGRGSHQNRDKLTRWQQARRYFKLCEFAQNVAIPEKVWVYILSVRVRTEQIASHDLYAAAYSGRRTWHVLCWSLCGRSVDAGQRRRINRRDAPWPWEWPRQEGRQTQGTCNAQAKLKRHAQCAGNWKRRQPGPWRAQRN